MRLPAPYELGQEFYRWEFATAVAGSILGINPFDQPNVQAAKDKTNEVLAAGEPDIEPRGSLDELFAQARPGDYVAVQAFIDPEREAELEPLLARAREDTGCVVTHGLGPRYLHSTGQLHKGGPNTGLFVQVVDDAGDELPIPGRDFGFRRLIHSQAAGDLASLEEREPQNRPNQTGGHLVQLGMVGLGRMGGNMTKRLEAAGHEVKTFDPHVEATASSLEELAQQLDAPRSVWLMVPAGIVDDVVSELAPHLEEGDTIVDGGNSYYVDDLRRATELREPGTPLRRRRHQRRRLGPRARLLPDDRRRRRGRRPAAAGFRGARAGRRLGRARTPGRDGDPAPEEQGWLHCGPNGAGHFVKMVHNGIEYGLMQSYAEGLNVLKHANIGMHAQETDAETTPLRDPSHYKYELDVPAVAELWRRGSVVASWLLDLGAQALHESPNLDDYAGRVSDSGEGRWTVQAAVEEGVPAPVLAASLFNRFASRGEADWGDRVLSAMRKAFGGHLEKSPEQ